MTSVVDTSVKHFNSTMSGAPVLNGVAGALAGVLDAVLRDGFDLKTPSSLIVSGGVATLAFPGSHSAQLDAVIVVAGSSIAALNGEQKVTAVAPGVVKFATAAADGTATGSITFKMAPLGFTSPFTGTNLRTYKSSDVTSTGMILRLDDTATTFARVRGYESMTDINTGTGLFPTDTQISGGGYWAKAFVASANPIAWAVIGDAKAFYLFIAPNSGATPAITQGWVRGFGDMVALRPGGDAYGCVLSCSAFSAATSMTDGTFDNINFATTLYSPRDFTGLGSSVGQRISPYTGNTASLSGVDVSLGTFPSRVDGTIKVSRKFICSSADLTPRLDVPGIFHVPQSLVFDTVKHLDVVPGTLALAGRNLVSWSGGNTSLGSTPNSSTTGALLFDRTGPWR